MNNFEFGVRILSPRESVLLAENWSSLYGKGQYQKNRITREMKNIIVPCFRSGKHRDIVKRPRWEN